ncbi:beta-propeller domain-containing protein [Micromonospora sp. NPDC049679]|uniref:beta-propeller domain-containing protein n=1 Tax=Micromonospora sp. NPDC049679 TaxID=3155920 RepID=UPI00340A5CB6
MRTRRAHRRSLSVATALALLCGCTAPVPQSDPELPPGGLQLVAFDSCADTLSGLKAAARQSVGPWGLPGSAPEWGFRGDSDGGPVAAEAGGARTGMPQQSGHSGTNNHEVGVDEPDMVKTDGRRIVTVTAGVLRSVDPRNRRITGELKLPGGGDDEQVRWAESTLLLHGDRALVLVPGGSWGGRPAGIVADDRVRPGAARPLMLLVDLTNTPTLLEQYRIDGTIVDARQVAGTARVVVRSTPRLIFPQTRQGTDGERLAENRKAIDAAPIEQWLPRYEITSAGRTRDGQVGCDRVSHPATYSGTSMATVLSFDLGRSELSDGDPLTIVGDGDTVYSNGGSLYLVNDQRWRSTPGWDRASARGQITEIYQFDTTKPGRPRYVTSAKVPGWVVNQYALSEWDGHLRVATTEGPAGDPTKQSSTVYVLRADGKTLRETGRVGGLGRGERIYSVRFTDDKGYVVTFRQTDPLYTVDLRDPAAPRVAGELKITGYSAYLHPVDSGRLIGVGQEATTQGRTAGTQVSLFDVSDPAKPGRLAQHHVRQSTSEAEYDPHAFLYWPGERLLVVPLQQTNGSGGALVLRVSDSGLAELGVLTHAASTPGSASIRRSLIVAGALWTLSDAGFMITDLSTMDRLGWVPLT